MLALDRYTVVTHPADGSARDLELFVSVSVSLTATRRQNPGGQIANRREDRMKLLFIHERLGAFGGAEANIRITARELQARGHSTALLYAQGTGRDEAGCRNLFAGCHQIPREKSPLQDLIAQCAPDLIYLHSLENLDAMERVFEASVPVIRMVHDHSLYCLRSYKYNPLTRKPCTRPASGYCIFPCAAPITRNRGGLLPFKWSSFSDRRREIGLTHRCQALVAYSQHSKGELVGNGFDPKRIHIHVPMECQGERHPVSRFGERNLVLFAGQIIRGKGVDLLLRALSRIKTSFECIIAGDGSHRAYCERLCRRLGLASKVQFTGYLPPTELEKLYQDASVFAFSSVWPEPFGMAGPEAMRFGLPVVGFDAGGVREWLLNGENGFLVPWADTTAFAARIEDLLRDKELARRLGLNGRERVNREYNAARQIDGLEHLFSETIGGSRKKTFRESPILQNELEPASLLRASPAAGIVCNV